MTLTKAQKAELAEEVEHATRVLRDWLHPGDEVATVTIHGRGSRDWVECFAVSPSTPGRIERISYYVARVCGYRLDEKGIARDGCQYDKAHDTVDTLSRKLFGEGNQLTRNRLLG